VAGARGLRVAIVGAGLGGIAAAIELASTASTKYGSSKRRRRYAPEREPVEA
jgi:cation diffusion facilitator CzcD-associated flavoprotein CzcO